MADRLELQSKFEEILGNRNVYYNPPENLKMNYPCIRYTDKNISSTYANDKKYINHKCYECVLIHKKSNKNTISTIHIILDLPYCSFDRTYKSDGWDHDVFTIYH